MLKQKVVTRLLKAAEGSPDGVITLELLDSLKLASRQTLKVTLSRLAKSGRLLRLKRGVYCTNPMRDAFAAASAIFNGYVGFGSALYLHRMLAEIPFTIIVVTKATSAAKELGQYEFRAVSFGKNAVGSGRKGRMAVSTRAKTLFDCLQLPRYAPEFEKVVQAYAENPLSKKEWKEFDSYCGNASKRAMKRMALGKRMILEEAGK